MSELETFDCVNPAHLLGLLYCEGKINSLSEDQFEELSRTLDAFGLIQPDGNVDKRACEHEFKRIRNFDWGWEPFEVVNGRRDETQGSEDSDRSE